MITNKHVLNKMAQELKDAQDNSGDQERVKQHAHAIRLLCDLILDNQDQSEIKSSKPKRHLTDMEMKKMMGANESEPIVEEKQNLLEF